MQSQFGYCGVGTISNVKMLNCKLTMPDKTGYMKVLALADLSALFSFMSSSVAKPSWLDSQA